MNPNKRKCCLYNLFIAKVFWTIKTAFPILNFVTSRRTNAEMCQLGDVSQLVSKFSDTCFLPRFSHLFFPVRALSTAHGAGLIPSSLTEEEKTLSLGKLLLDHLNHQPIMTRKCIIHAFCMSC